MKLDKNKERYIKDHIRWIIRQSVSYLGFWIMCYKNNTCLLPWSMIFSFKLQELFGDKGKSARQDAFKIIVNIKIHAILEILPNSFKMG